MKNKVAPPNHRYRYSGLIDFRRVLQNSLDPKDLVASCVTCQNFDNENELCKIVTPNPMRPPAAIIAFGCPSYLDNDDIPF